MIGAPWWLDPDLTYTATAAATDLGEESMTLDEIDSLLFPFLSEIPTGTGEIAGVPPSQIPSTFSIEAYQAGSVEWAYDPISNVPTWIVPDSSGIPPLIARPDGPGSIINPAWSQHLFELYGNAMAPAANQVPAADPTVNYSGAGPKPAWSDVFNWAHIEAQAQAGNLFDTQTLTGAEAKVMNDIAIGTTIKALGGVINHAVGFLAASNLSILSRVQGNGIATVVAFGQRDAQIKQLGDQLFQLVEQTIPDLLTQLADTKNGIPLQIQEAINANNVQIRDAWITPLKQDLATETQQRITSVKSVESSIPVIADQVAKAAVAPALAIAAGLATRIGTLETESENCVKPMCSLLGPASALGKLLKALNLLSDAALLAWLLGKTEPEIAQVLEQVIGDFAHVVDTVATEFITGGKTIGATLTDAIGNVVS